MKIVSAHQPHYLPWIGYLNKIALSNVFMLMDSLEFTRHSYINRNRIIIQRQPKWISLPVNYSAGSKQKIKDLRLSGDVKKVLRHHVNTIKNNYQRCRGFQTFFPGLEFVMGKEYKFLFDLDFEILQYLLSYLEIKTPVILQSEKKVSGKKEDSLITSIVHSVDANHILLGLGKSNEYIHAEKIEDQHIKILTQKFSHPIYSQSTSSFAKGISSLDMLMHVPREKAIYLVLHAGGVQKRRNKN